MVAFQGSSVDVCVCVCVWDDMYAAWEADVKISLLDCKQVR